MVEELIAQVSAVTMVFANTRCSAKKTVRVFTVGRKYIHLTKNAASARPTRWGAATPKYGWPNIHSACTDCSCEHLGLSLFWRKRGRVDIQYVGHVQAQRGTVMTEPSYNC